MSSLKVRAVRRRLPLCVTCHSKIHGCKITTPELTKAALAAYKARGGRLGSHDPRCKPLSAEARAKGHAAGVVVNREKAKEAYADLLPTILKLREDGLSLKSIANLFNKEGHTTRGDKPWNPVQVKRVLDRA